MKKQLENILIMLVAVALFVAYGLTNNDQYNDEAKQRNEMHMSEGSFGQQNPVEAMLKGGAR